MPRKPRFIIPGVPIHIVQRGHSKATVFFENDDYHAYLFWLQEAAIRYSVDVHAYVLMTNHIHLLATPSTKDGITRMMQYVGRYYVPYINHAYGTSGTLWEGRYKSNLIQSEHYLLTCMRYIEMNPVRAKMVRSPIHYRWSSYRYNAQGKNDSLVTPHSLYTSLGKGQTTRLAAYKDLFTAHIDKVILDGIRAAWQTGTPLGNDYFKEKIEKKLKCKVGQARRGRPTKLVDESI